MTFVGLWPPGEDALIEVRVMQVGRKTQVDKDGVYGRVPVMWTMSKDVEIFL